MTDKICMFDIDNTLSRYGIPIHLSLLRKTIQTCRLHNCQVFINTNRPFTWINEFLFFFIKFDGYYGNTRKVFGLPIGFMIDWFYSREYISKINNLDCARKKIPRNMCMIIDDNQNTIHKCNENGFSTISVSKNGFNQESLEELKKWLMQ